MMIIMIIMIMMIIIIIVVVVLAIVTVIILIIMIMMIIIIIIQAGRRSWGWRTTGTHLEVSRMKREGQGGGQGLAGPVHARMCSITRDGMEAGAGRIPQLRSS